MNKKVLGIGITLVVIIIAGVLIWKNQCDEKVEPTSEDENQGQVEITEEALGWKTYESQEYGFRLQYPNDWAIREVYDPGYDTKGFYFEKIENAHFAVFPRGGVAQGVAEPKITIEKFKNRESRMFWYDNKSYPSFIYILSEYPNSWNKDNRIEIIGENEYSEDLKKIYDSFGFID
jgi:hypothetical protein